MALTNHLVSTMSLTVKKRCLRCLHVLRPDGTCENPKCKKYVPEPEPEDSSTEEDNK